MKLSHAGRAILTLLAVGGLLFPPRSVQAQMTDFSKKGPNLFETSPGWSGDNGKSEISGAVTRLEAPVSGKFSFKVPVEPNSEYFFSAKVKSDGRAVFTAGRLSMSYHDQGNWGEVCGLVPVDNREEVEIAVQIRTLDKTGVARAELKEVVLRKVERPTAVFGMHRPGETALAVAGRAEAAVVYPAAIEAEKELALSVKKEIEALTGVALPVLADTEVTESDAPIVKPEYREKNLILIGRLGTNRAMAAAYAHFLDAVDGYYPGGDGYVVRTAANVFGNGRNHLILGGSEPAGVARAVKQFLGLLEKGQAPEKGTLRLPWLLDVKLAGKCLETFRADDARWRDPANPALPPMSSGYGKVSRWYQNAIGYYWSGLPDYLERSRGYLKEILADKAYTHHYLVEFMVRSYDMFNESPILTEADKRAMDALVLENFLDFMTGSDASWMTVFSPPYAELGLSNRHQIAPWYADLVMAEFLRKNLRLSGELKQLVDFRAGEKDKAFRHLVSNRSGPNRYELGNASYEEVTAVFYRYAMENDLYREFFASGLAHHALGLERLNPLNGRLTMPVGLRDVEPLLGAAAIVKGDGRYRWVRENTPFPARELGSFQGRYVGEVHRYVSGGELPAVRPDESWSGIAISPEPTRRDATLTPPTREFPLVVMRSGFGPKDDYVAITGIDNQQPAGTLAAMIVAGNPIFMAASPESGGAANRTTTNGATAIRLTDYSPAAGTSGDEACTLAWAAQFAGCWAFQTETALTPEVLWSRETIRLQPGVFLFCDRFTASRSGDYALRVNWQPGTRIEEIGETEGGWQLALPTGTVGVTMAGEGFNAERRGGTLTWAAMRSLEAGKAATVWTVVQSRTGKEPWVAAAAGSGDQLSVTPPGSDPVILHAGDLPHASGMLKADLTVMDKAGISIFGLRDSENPKSESSRCLYLPASPKGGSRQASAAPGKEGAMPRELEKLAGLAGEIETALRAGAATPEQNPASSAIGAVTIRDQTGEWKKRWSYDGLRRPQPVHPRAIDENTVDFGKVVSLHEVRSVTSSKRVWEPSYLPKRIEVAPESASVPPSGADGWTPLSGERKSRPGTRTGNYGESHPVAHADESFFVKGGGVRTRFLKAEGAANARYFINDRMAARHPVRVEILRDLPGAGTPVIVASSHLFPAFPRPLRDDDFSLALLKPEGTAMAELEIAGPVQGLLVADRQGRGEAEIMVLKADARIETFDLSGKPGPGADLAAMHKGFDKQYGHPNTRHPAGGLWMPFSFGLWRANPAGAKKMVVARYGNLSFLDENLRLEGVLAAGPYACSGMLRRGYDFDDSGKEEMLILERSRLIQVGGDSTARVRYEKPSVFWPEVYDTLSEKGARDSNTRLLAGAPIHVFDLLERFGGRPRYAMVVRENYAGLYDAVEKNWVFSWQPPAPIAAAAITRETADEAEIRLSTIDGLLWKVTWAAEKPGSPGIEVAPFGRVAEELRGSPSRDGSALMSTGDGLLLIDPDGGFSRIADGAFQSADFLSEGSGDGTIVAADRQGRVVAFERNPASGGKQ